VDVWDVAGDAGACLSGTRRKSKAAFATIGRPGMGILKISDYSN